MDNNINIIEQPLYYPAFASKLSGLTTGRIKRWLRGYNFEYKISKGEILVHSKSDPIIPREPEKLPEYVSFLELIDLLFVKEFLNQNFSLQKIRIALSQLYKITGQNHFAQERFFTFQKRIYIDKEHKSFDLLSGCQGAISDFVEQLGGRIDFHSVSGFPLRWYPIGREKLIVIDPYISFGRPTIEGTGINTETIYNMYIGENEDIDKVGFWMKLDNTKVKAAVNFEIKLRAA